MKSVPIPWTKQFFDRHCPCGSGKQSYRCCWKRNMRWEKTSVGVLGSSEASEPRFENDRCYLSALGNCDAKTTREHFISRNILERITSDLLTIQGAGHFFGGGERVEIGIDAFSSKVLCDTHNSALSPLDSAVGTTFSTMEATVKDLERIASSKGLKSFHLASGKDIERWMIKVYCGLIAAGKIRGKTGRILDRSSLPPYLLEAMLGRGSLPEPLGMYHHSFAGQKRRLAGISIGTIMLTDGSDDVGGLLLSLGFFNFVLITSMDYGRRFSEPTWYRHPNLLLNVKQTESKIAYLLTY